ncbi:MAG: GspH/FimT family pseudopilin [Betaproteobacteria bacterium]|nr:GspH/FimT family pseudopilin [Betaproteobacteria bacterium]
MRARQSGVTLIEFMIGFLILGILVGLAVPSFRDWIINSQVRTATDSINDGLQLSRAEAVRRNSPVRWRLPDETTSGWVIEALNRTTAAWDQIQVRNAGEGTTNVVVAASQTTVTFVGSGFVSPLPAQNITINVSNPNGGDCLTQAGVGDVRCLRVTVTAGGSIRMCDPASPSTSASAC